MQYSNIYSDLMNTRKSFSRTKNDENYYELHHIIPKCLGGTNKKENLVFLTPKEHFIAHLLLVKIYPKNSKLTYAICAFQMKKNERKLTSNQYSKIKIQNVKNMTGNEPWNKGLKLGPQSDELKKRKSKTLKEFWKDKSGNRKGIPPWNSGKTGVQIAWNKGIKMPTVTCPHCNKIGDKSNMKRWHFNNCKSLITD